MKENKPRGKIIVASITEDILKMLPDDPSDMTEEEIHKFALAVFRRCVRYEGGSSGCFKTAEKIMMRMS